MAGATGAATMYLLTGLSFAGKSTLARAICRTIGGTIVDPDAVARERGLGTRGEFVADEQWSVIHAEAQRRAAALLRGGQTVIYDTTGYDRAERDQLRALAIEQGVAPVTIYVRIAPDEATRRWERNNRTASAQRFISTTSRWSCRHSRHPGPMSPA